MDERIQERHIDFLHIEINVLQVFNDFCLTPSFYDVSFIFEDIEEITSSIPYICFMFVKWFAN